MTAKSSSTSTHDDLGDVHRFLVTGPEPNLQRFHLAMASLWNAIERRHNTVLYTAFARDAAVGLADVAPRADVTVQEVEIVDGEETYPVRHDGTHHMQWRRP